MKEILILVEDGEIKLSFYHYSVAFRYVKEELKYNFSYRTFKRHFEEKQEMFFEKSKLVKTDLLKK